MIEELKGKILSDKRNLIVNGDNLSGKTKDVIFPIIDEKISNNESLIIYDTKDEYINNYYRILKEKNYNVVVLNYRDLDKSEAWNPLSYPYKLYKEGNENKAIEYLNQIGDTLFYLSDEEPFWTNTSRDFFTGACLALFEDASEEEINISSVAAVLNGFEEQLVNSNYTCEYFKMRNQDSKAAILASKTYLAPKETRASIISIVAQKMMVLLSRVKLVNLLSTTTINYEDLRTKPSAVFVLAPESNTVRGISLIFVSQIVKMLIENGSESKYNIVLEDIESVEFVQPLKDLMGYQLFDGFKFYVTSVDLDELFKNYFSFNRFSLLLKVEQNKFTLLSGREQFEYSKEEDRGILADYPGVQRNNLAVFDLKSFVDKKRHDKINEMLSGVVLSKPKVDEEKIQIANEMLNELDSKNDEEEITEEVTEVLDEVESNEVIDELETKSSKDEEQMRKINEMLDNLESNLNEEKIQEYSENITDNLDKEMSDDLKNYEADFAESYELENADDTKDYEVDFNEEKDNNNEVDLTNNKYTIDELVKLIDEKIAKIEAEEELQQENDENN